MDARSYGMICWQQQYGCKEQVSVPLVNDDDIAASRALEIKATNEGWVIGLVSSGQAFYSCPGCAPGLFNALPIAPLHLRESKP